ncbi:hypothetical protein B0I35DRAFT_126539 [Stachybotrys elegans]|uniref:Uncharacterized protein n=1 Tax=Stachybotrys elegans TaxID=80388 RepID=A0A8K0WWR3_9HYPO|nr:hypothetical protein B0I35DRAFT_126539 [Stachybotrys elegans]
MLIRHRWSLNNLVLRGFVCVTHTQVRVRSLLPSFISLFLRLLSSGIEGGDCLMMGWVEELISCRRDLPSSDKGSERVRTTSTVLSGQVIGRISRRCYGISLGCWRLDITWD